PASARARILTTDSPLPAAGVARYARSAMRPLLVLVVALALPAAAFASCGDNPGDAVAVATVRTAIDEACDCVGTSSHGAYLRCVLTQARAGVQARQLPRGCKGSVIRCAARSTCGKPGFVTCCRTSPTGDTACKVKRNPAHCVAPTGGSACVGVVPSCCDACLD